MTVRRLEKMSWKLLWSGGGGKEAAPVTEQGGLRSTKVTWKPAHRRSRAKGRESERGVPDYWGKSSTAQKSLASSIATKGVKYMMRKMLSGVGGEDVSVEIP